MRKKYNIILITLSCLLFSCASGEKKLQGSWESILVENESALFAKTLPSSVKGEILLTFSDSEKFTWINNSEKLNLSGSYNSGGNKIYFIITGDAEPLEVKFRFHNDRLIINTGDGFTFTFTKK